MNLDPDYLDLLAVGATHDEALATLLIINAPQELFHGNQHQAHDRQAQEDAAEPR